MSFALFGLQFHLYGLIVGIAAAAGILLGEKIVEKDDTRARSYWVVITAMMVGGMIGARAYHVWTDWSLYAAHLDRIFQIWNGGLSIIGGVIGALIAVSIVVYYKSHSLKDVLFWADVGALCLPLSQAIGRLGNFVNQELYGAPSSLPWALYIDPAHRAAGFEHVSHFHPLFAYEAIGMLLFLGVVWWLRSKCEWKTGKGNAALLYFAWYGLFRGCLEFLRLEKAPFLQTGLGLNQVILFTVGGISSIVLLMRLTSKHHSSSAKQLAGKSALLGCVLVLSLGLSGCHFREQPERPAAFQSAPEQMLSEEKISQLKDHSKNNLWLSHQNGAAGKMLTVEIVNSAKSVEQGLSDRESIGSDGMLFIFPSTGPQTFWMPRMKFDIDIVWINNGIVLGIFPNVPKPTSVDQDELSLPKYPSPQQVDMVLELPAGSSKTWQIEVGDALDLL